NGDFDGMRPWLADNFVFDGPLMSCDGPDDYIRTTQASAAQFTGASYEINDRLVVAGQAVILSTLTVHGTPVRTAEHFVVRDGKIASVRLYFDPAPLHPPPGAD
ncbi:MAG: nuclear transport factor 2 family protein, partial [Myxococcota bacterium]